MTRRSLACSFARSARFTAMSWSASRASAARTAAQLRRVGAGDPGPIAREVDGARERAAVFVGLRQPLLRQRIERHLAAGKLGKLHLGLHAVADAEAGAGDPVLAAAPVPVAHALQGGVALGGDGRDAGPYRYPRRPEPGHVPDSLGEGPPAPQQSGSTGIA